VTRRDHRYWSACALKAPIACKTPVALGRVRSSDASLCFPEIRDPSFTRAGLAALALTLSPGCAMRFDATDLGVPTSMAEAAKYVHSRERPSA